MKPSGFRLCLLAFALSLIGLPPASADSGGNILKISATFTDDRGQETTLAAWHGRPAIVTMEYANCRFICSITLQRLKDVQAAADRANRAFDFIVISLDPGNDTPEAWRRYRKSRELDRDNWRFLTASSADTPRIARTLGVKYWVYDGHIMHDFRLLRTDAAGAIVKIMDTYDASPDEFVR